MRMILAIALAVSVAGPGVSFASSDTPAQPVATEASIEDTAPETTYGPGCPFGGQEEASTEDVVS